MRYKLLTVICCYSISIAQASNSCRTPNNTQGECYNILKCRGLASLLHEKHITPEHATYLSKSQSHCGFEGILPKVCCPLDEIIEDKRKLSETPSFDTTLLPTREECGTDTAQDRIFGGKATSLSEFPWVVLIHHQSKNGKEGFHCGGVLISSKYVLTAAHCLKGKRIPSSWNIDSVRLGEHDLTTNPDSEVYQQVTKWALPVQNILIEEVTVHEDYDRYDLNQNNDVALLRLSTAAEISDFVRPICLPIFDSDHPQNMTGKKMTVSGWGRTENSTSSNVKLKVKLPVLGHLQCVTLYREKHRTSLSLKDSQFCAGGDEGKDSCNGDSGGPLMSHEKDKSGNINWYVRGIVSIGSSDCGSEDWPGIYTKVINYIPWILSKLRV